MNLDVSNPTRAALPPHAPGEIRHYPATLIDMRALPDGTRLTLRPVLPQDAPLLGGLVARLSAAGRRNRFHGGCNLGATQLERMSCVDYARELALVVTTCTEGTERVIVDARYCLDADAQGAEFALMVDEHWQRRGLGCWAMQALGGAAQAAGLTWLHGDVLTDNLPMRALMLRCGLCCTLDPEDDRLMQAQLRLGDLPAPRPAAPPLGRRGMLARLARGLRRTVPAGAAL